MLTLEFKIARVAGFYLGPTSYDGYMLTWTIGKYSWVWVINRGHPDV